MHESHLLLREREIPLVVRKIKGARRFSVRYRPLTHDVLLTMPWRIAREEGLAFARSRAAWLEQQLERHGAHTPFADGAVLPVQGAPCTLRHLPGARGVAERVEAELRVPGDAAFVARRVGDWLKALARREIETQARAQAARLGKRIRRIALRDTSSRWGSCSATGELSFSWRLIFAPPEVLEYVVCHEVAHLAELNHSERFWRIVAELCPAHARARLWLKRHGHTLYRYG